MKRLFVLLSILSCFAFAQENTPDWVKRSDAYTERVNKAEAQFTPEGYQEQGVEGLDDKILDLNPGYLERSRKATRETIDWLRKFFQAEDGIRDLIVTGVQTCALPISARCVSRTSSSATTPAARSCSAS